jgi:PAS domain-containing protein
MKKRLPLGRWTKQNSKDNLSEEKNSPPTPPISVSDDKSSQHEAARLEALINSIDQIVLELDAEGTFLNIWANDEKLLYRPRSELLGRRSEDIFDADFFRSSHELFKRVIATGKGEDFEYSLNFPEGERWFLARVNRIDYPDGRENGLPGHTRNFRSQTRRKKPAHFRGEVFQSIPGGPGRDRDHHSR